jgi:uncharacterized membrane protein YfcA
MGLGAGALTTIAGQGGGLLLLLALTATLGPRQALAITAPALAFGNLHRAFMLRQHIHRPTALRMIAGALPGAVIGGMLAGIVPAWSLRVLMVLLTAAAIVKALGYLRFSVPRGAFAPAGFAIGGLTGTAGGAGVLLGPILLASGLSGPTYVATTSTVAVATHIGRVVGYAGLGLFSMSLVAPTIAITGAIFVGNAIGGRVQQALTPRRATFIEYGALVACVLLAAAGLDGKP